MAKRPTDLDHQRELVRLKTQLASDVYGHASTYDNAIVFAGYAAFFGLWAGVADDVSATSRTLTAAIMGVSLMLYIAWHLGQMLNRQRFEFERADAFKLENEAQAFLAKYEDIKRRQEAATNRLIRFWWPIFLASVVLGFLGAIILVWNAIAVAFDLPLQLTG